VVILDLGLPGIDGIEVAQALRGWSNVPIIVLSARGAEAVKVAALDIGADDYVTKPFGMDELLARIRAALRRTHDAGQPTVITTADFTIDLADQRVHGPHGEVRLTPTQWHLIEVLARKPGRLVSQQQLLTEVWGPGHEQASHYLRVFMAQIRQKLEPDPAHPRYFHTEPGRGYRLDTDPG
jgi:two-component system KDP operon response regulator KdpE